MNLKTALRIYEDEKTAIHQADGELYGVACRVIAARAHYLTNPRDYGLELIEAITNWMVATGRAEGEQS